MRGRGALPSRELGQRLLPHAPKGLREGLFRAMEKDNGEGLGLDFEALEHAASAALGRLQFRPSARQQRREDGAEVSIHLLVLTSMNERDALSKLRAAP